MARGDERIVLAVRGLLRKPGETDLARFVTESRTRARAVLRSFSYFRGDFEAWANDVEVAALSPFLPAWPDRPLAAAVRALARELYRFLDPRPYPTRALPPAEAAERRRERIRVFDTDPQACTAALLAQDSEHLVITIDSLLRARARQEMHRNFAHEERHRARILRQIRAAVSGDDALRRVRRGWHECVALPDASFDAGPVSEERIEETFACWSDISDIRTVLSRLRAMLEGGRGHGGYARLFEVVRVVHDRRIALGSPGPLTPFRPSQVAEERRYREKILGFLVRTEERLYDRSRTRVRKKHPAKDGPGCRPVRARIANEMVLRDFGLGRPEWEGRPQRSLLEEQLPPERTNGNLGWHVQQTTYLVRKLREELYTPGVLRRILGLRDEGD